MITEFTQPEIAFNPITANTLEVIEHSQIRLKPVKRYVHINETDRLINLYIDLTDGIIILTIPVKYYMWNAVQFTPTVLCDYTKLQDGNNSYSCVEINQVDKVNMKIVEENFNALEEGNSRIPECYTRYNSESCLVKTMLNGYGRGLASGVGTCYIRNNSIYVRALCAIPNLLNRDTMYEVCYRELEINGKKYIVDVEAVSKIGRR